MDLKIKDVAELLSVSESTVRRWLSEEKIPAYRIQQQYRFNRVEIENWVMARKGETEAKDLASHVGTRQFSLFRALNKGGVYKDIPGHTKEEIIANSVKLMSRPLGFDADVVAELLLDRESLFPTALNQGIALPHTRDFYLSGWNNAVGLVYPKKPVEYGALDGEPVFALFFLFASDDKEHLHLLAKVAHFCNSEESRKFLRSKPDLKTVLDRVKSWEKKVYTQA